MVATAVSHRQETVDECLTFLHNPDMTAEIHLYGQSLSNSFSNQNKCAGNGKIQGAPKGCRNSVGLLVCVYKNPKSSID